MTSFARAPVGALLVVVAVGCSGGSGSVDAGAFDAGSRDTGASDAGGTDAPAEVPPGSRITVVFRVDMNGGLDRNCAMIVPDRWLEVGALDDPARTAFLVGGVHDRTPICSGERTTHCVTEDERASLDEALGNWAPNRIEMYDDGTRGDLVAGDRIYAVAVDVPYWDPADAPDGAGMRLGYKFTWGEPGALWTGTEEWPGNQRLLEVVDVNGDGAVLRQDIFGDETTNKDTANLLTPANGGCGLVLFAAEQAGSSERADCVMDSRENRIDTDGDCDLDTYPPLR